MTNKNNILKYKDLTDYEKLISNPRIQIDEENFEYIEADRGFLYDDDYIFENVKMSGDYGDATAGKLEIKDNKNLLIFTENPNFTIYINNL